MPPHHWSPHSAPLYLAPQSNPTPSIKTYRNGFQKIWQHFAVQKNGLLQDATLLLDIAFASSAVDDCKQPFFSHLLEDLERHVHGQLHLFQLVDGYDGVGGNPVG